MTPAFTLYRCPVHGLIEAPWAADTDDPDQRPICPVNLSRDRGGITDDLCQAPCDGPISVREAKP